MTQMLKTLPAMRETWVRSLGWEDPLEKRKATHSSILAWRIPWTSPWAFSFNKIYFDELIVSTPGEFSYDERFADLSSSVNQ